MVRTVDSGRLTLAMVEVPDDQSEIEHFFSLKNDFSWENGTTAIDLTLVGEPGRKYSLILREGLD